MMVVAHRAGELSPFAASCNWPPLLPGGSSAMLVQLPHDVAAAITSRVDDPDPPSG
jgi:hypothetical protein